MKKTLFVLILLLFAITASQAGTLSQGVHIGPMLSVASANGNPQAAALKYQQAVDRFIGWKNRYVVVTNVTNNNQRTTKIVENNGEVSFNENPNIFNDGSGQTFITSSAQIESGYVAVTSNN